jgi:adenosylcobinamide kinase / adenosylcobinamide-phosphate guanylyltransferase
MGELTFITGPARSGKSRRAVGQAKPWGNDTVFVATYALAPQDPEMMERVQRHRAERPAWRTLEAPLEQPLDISASLAALSPPPSGVIIDCLTLWAAARLGESDEAITAAWNRQVTAFAAAPWPTIVVSNELGWSLVPPEPLSRRFRDLAGTLSQLTSAAADQVWLMVAGCSVRLK